MRLATLIVLTLLELAVFWAARRSVVRHGGDWVARDGWFGWDKLDHGMGGIAALVVLAGLAFWGHPLLLAWAFLLVLAGVEALELARLASWIEKGRPAPRPAMCDGVSYKDMVWGAAGGAVGLAALLRVLP